MIKTANANGLLFVGDPHLWSKSPSKRLDVSFMETVLDKIEQAVQIANEKKLLLVFLGDLFHDDTDNDSYMLVKLIRILKKLKQKPITIVGNHEKTETTLTDGTALAILREANIIDTIENNGIHYEIKINDEKIYIGGTPYGQTIPHDISNIIKKNKIEGEFIIWLTHHDLAFNETYPGAMEMYEIIGANIVVNGHIHKTKDSLQIGMTKYFNPGNITRMSTDCLDHKPSVWEWYPTNKYTLVQKIINFEKDSFNLIGNQIEATIKVQKLSTDETQLTKFAQLLKDDNDIDEIQSDDGEKIKDNIKKLGIAMDLKESLLAEILEIAELTIKKG